jgi:hypothetical protein
MTLATTHSALGNTNGAIGIANNTLLNLRAVVTEQDVYTMACRNNLAIFLRKANRHDEAFPHADRVCRQLAEALAEGHPYIFIGRLNLATDLLARGDTEAALEHDQAAFEGLLAAFGDEHPDTIAAANNLALSRIAAGDASGATLHEEMLALARTTMGLANPRVRSAELHERINCYIEPPPP